MLLRPQSGERQILYLWRLFLHVLLCRISQVLKFQISVCLFDFGFNVSPTAKVIWRWDLNL